MKNLLSKNPFPRFFIAMWQQMWQNIAKNNCVMSMQPSQQKCRVSIHMKAVSPLKPLLKIGFREIFDPMGVIPSKQTPLLAEMLYKCQL